MCACAGPVDGPAIFRQVQGCKVAVASQQCQVVDSSDLDLGKPFDPQTANATANCMWHSSGCFMDRQAQWSGVEQVACSRAGAHTDSPASLHVAAGLVVCSVLGHLTPL